MIDSIPADVTVRRRDPGSREVLWETARPVSPAVDLEARRAYCDHRRERFGKIHTAQSHRRSDPAECRARKPSCGAARPKIGYVPQSGGLYPDLTVEENLKLRRALWLRKRLSANWARTVAALDLQGTLERTPAELSGGLQRLATIAAALHVEPDWLLLDEPFQGLDPRRRTLLVEHLALISARLQLLVITAPAENDFGLLTKTIRMVGGRIE